MKSVPRPNGPNKKFVPLDPQDILTDGDWVLRGSTKIWVRHECEDCGGYLPPNARCDTCLTWAVKDARDFEWARISWENRSQVWDILALRDEIGAAA